ncbi:MAG: hypothetical protein ACI8X5_003063 [Planctomycetota bacterium]|jgi:hypothetical protein
MKTIDMDDVSPPDGPKGPRPTPRRTDGGGGGKKTFLTIVPFLLLLFAFFIMLSSGNLGVTQIRDDQVAVKVNYVTGSQAVIEEPGFKIYLPFLEEIFLLDQTPQKYLMEGNQSRGDNYAPFLSVRASDGSNFSFETLEIQYRIIPSMAREILHDSGAEDGFKREWMRAHARSILRDEFGRISAVQVANPVSYSEATERSTKRMNEILQPHGVHIIRLITPKPRFDKSYEQAIEKKKFADQTVAHLKVKEVQYIEERKRELANVSRTKEIEWEELQGELRRIVLSTERKAIEIKKDADAYKVTRESQGQQQRDRFTAEALGLTAKYTKEAEGIRARTEALEKRGKVVVREALIEKLRGIRFTLVPYSKDPAPQRLEHEGSAGTAQKSGNEGDN